MNEYAKQKLRDKRDRANSIIMIVLGLAIWAAVVIVYVMQ